VPPDRAPLPESGPDAGHGAIVAQRRDRGAEPRLRTPPARSGSTPERAALRR
jgi:hypothetical protein